jgi:imidazole glycerol phosphate synthase glutamine amidotransferase subunit
VRTVHVVRTSTANLAAVVAAFERLGREAVLTSEPEAVATAERLVLPGVGAFGAAARAVGEAGLVDALRERMRAGRPTLAICLGLQLMAEASDEAPGVPGLSVVPGVAGRFRGDGLRIPHMGWNRVTPSGSGGLVTAGDAYFAHTYRLAEDVPGWVVSTADYGGPFVAAVERGPVLACQFHPELSGRYGAAVLARWLEAKPC